MHPKVVSFASINIDEVYSVPHIVKPGETISALKRQQNAGGKGANTSVAAARAGGDIHVVGKIGVDGEWVRDIIRESGANTEFINVSKDISTGRAIIQVDQQGENCIFLFAGANHQLTKENSNRALSQFNEGDWLLLTNETTAVGDTIEKAHGLGMQILWNPAPMPRTLLKDIGMDIVKKVDVLVLNESELLGLASQIGGNVDENIVDLEIYQFVDITKQMMDYLATRTIVVTLGYRGSIGLVRKPKSNSHSIPVGSKISKPAEESLVSDDESGITEILVECAPIEKSQVADTTAAGDTWVGYFVAELARMQGESPESIGSRAELTPAMVHKAMVLASFASGITVTRMGAIPSIPDRSEVEDFIKRSHR